MNLDKNEGNIMEVEKLEYIEEWWCFRRKTEAMITVGSRGIEGRFSGQPLFPHSLVVFGLWNVSPANLEMFDKKKELEKNSAWNVFLEQFSKCLDQVHGKIPGDLNRYRAERYVLCIPSKKSFVVLEKRLGRKRRCPQTLFLHNHSVFTVVWIYN